MNEDNSQALSQIEPEPLPHEDTKPPDQPFFIPNDPDQGVYRFILAAAKRARQLQAGATDGTGAGNHLGPGARQPAV